METHRLKFTIGVSLCLHLMLILSIAKKPNDSKNVAVPIGVSIIFNSTSPTISANNKAMNSSIENPKQLPPVSNKKNTLRRQSKEQKISENSEPNSLIKTKQPAGELHGQKAISAKEKYLYELKLSIEQHKFYPQAAKLLGQQGLIKVQFDINPQGEFSNISIFAKSQHNRLNSAALALIKKMRRFKPLPEEIKKGRLVVTLPLEYTLN